MKNPEGNPGSLVATVVLVVAIAVGAAAGLSGGAAGGVTGGGPPAHRGCVSYYPRFYRVYVQLPGNSDVGGVDASGCDSWVYQILNLGIPLGFFAGGDFRPGVTAYEYGTLERTLLIGKRQLIRVVNPSKDWLEAYDGFDTCSESRSSSERICLAAAVSPRPADWYWFAGGVAALVALVLFMVHYVRPAGPIRRRRRFRESQRGLAAVVQHGEAPVLTTAEVRQLERRLRKLERAIASELSESQQRWFVRHLASGRHGVALETLARAIARKLARVPDPIREEFEWLATSLEMREAVASILEARRVGAESPSARQGSPAEGQAGFDVPLDRFRSLVAEAVDSLPEELGRAMTNVAIIVEEGTATGEAFGHYIGTPLSRRRHLQWNVRPDRIVIFRKTICAYCDSEEEVRARVYITVIHEIAHHFGISDARLEELGWV